MVAWLGLLRSLAIYWRPGRQRSLRRLYRPFAGAGDLVFDVGAHLGDRAMAFAALGARVVAIEPQPHVARWLRWLAGRRSIDVRVEAVGRIAGTARMALSHRTPTVSTLADDWRLGMPAANRTFRHVRWDDTVEVPVTTLDALIDRYGPPRFCKIDVEGYEADVLAGLTQRIAALSVEFVSGRLDVADACVRRLDTLGEYEFNAIPNEARTYVFDEWVSADRLREWLRDGASGAASGDVYARVIADAGVEARPPGAAGDV